MSIDATRWAWQQRTNRSTWKLVLLSLADRSGENFECFPSISRLSEDTELDRKTVITALAGLEKRGIIAVRNKINGKKNAYCLVGVRGRHDKTSTENGTGTSTENGTGTKNGTSPKNGTRPVPKTVPDQSQKRDTNLSITNQEPPTGTRGRPNASSRASKASANSWTLPPTINAEVWSEFEQHRKEIKKPLKDLARTKNANVLLTMSPTMQRACVDKTIASGWAGLFHPQNNAQQNNAQPQNKPTAASRRSLADELSS